MVSGDAKPEKSGQAHGPEGGYYEPIEVEFIDDDSDSEDEPTTETHLQFATIVDIIDNLYKLSIHIRNPKTRTNYSNAATFKAIDKETNIDLVSQYVFWDVQHARNVFNELRKDLPAHLKAELADDPLIERLGRLNTRRRQQFMYWERHRDKLAAENATDEIYLEDKYKIEQGFILKPAKALDADVNSADIPKSNAGGQSTVTRSVLTATTATLFVPQQASDDVQSVVSTTTTARATMLIRKLLRNLLSERSRRCRRRGELRRPRGALGSGAVRRPLLLYDLPLEIWA